MKKIAFLFLALLLIVFNLITPIQAKAQEGQEFKPKPLDPQLISCLKEQVGEDVFEIIKTGSRKPSDEEIKKGEICFQKFGAPQFQGPKKPPQKSDFSPQTAACLEKTVGVNFTDQMTAIRSHDEAEEFKTKTKNCFGMPPPQGEGDQENPEELQKTKDCLVAAVGQAQVDKMFTGEKPEPGSEMFNKIESSGCFKKMNFRPKDGPKENLSPETEKCLREVLGDNFMKEGDNEPSEDKKREAGEKCFGGRGPDDQEQGPGRMSLPAEVESCLKAKVGERYKQGPDSLSESEKQSMGECFQKNNFQPMGDRGQQNKPEINMDPATKACIEKVTGDIKNQPTEDQKKQISEECFKRPEPSQNFNNPQNQPPNQGMINPEFKNPEGGNPPPMQDNSCVKNIIGDQKEPLPQELRDRIEKECFGSQPPTNQPMTQPPPDGQIPFNQPPEEENRFFFSLPQLFKRLVR